jgi:hypothetical protein
MTEFCYQVSQLIGVLIGLILMFAVGCIVGYKIGKIINSSEQVKQGEKA